MFKLWQKKKDEFTTGLEKFLGFEINNAHLYKEALSHSSKKLEYNYQRLEFLGDAVLNLVVSTYLFNQYKNFSEGDLSKLRAKLINKQILKDVALKLQLDKYIQHQLSAAELEKSSLYCDVMEALIGAIYMDKGIKAAEHFIKEKIIHQLNEVTEIEDTDYKSKIIQLAQKHKWQIKFHLEKTEKINNENIFYIALIINNKKISEGKHYNKKQAEQLASMEALKVINEME